MQADINRYIQCKIFNTLPKDFQNAGASVLFYQRRHLIRWEPLGWVRLKLFQGREHLLADD